MVFEPEAPSSPACNESLRADPKHLVTTSPAGKQIGHRLPLACVNNCAKTPLMELVGRIRRAPLSCNGAEQHVQGNEHSFDVGDDARRFCSGVGRRPRSQSQSPPGQPAGANPRRGQIGTAYAPRGPAPGAPAAQYSQRGARIQVRWLSVPERTGGPAQRPEGRQPRHLRTETRPPDALRLGPPPSIPTA